MGINGLLPRILPSAGRENYDLRALKDGIVSLTTNAAAAPVQEEEFIDNVDEQQHQKPPPSKRRRRPETSSADATKSETHKRSSWTRRKVRIAVDVNGWISRAAHGYGGTLMDERHLSYHGRAELRNQKEQQEQRQLEEERGGEEHAENEHDGEHDNAANRNNNSNDAPQQQQQKQQQQIQAEQRLQYIQKIVSFTLKKIESMRDECSALVLPVLDGNTPPCKREVVKERSDRRKRAVEERDQLLIQGIDQNDDDDNNNAEGGAADEENNDNINDNEAARTEAEVLSKISKSKSGGMGKDYSMRRDLLSALLDEFRNRKWPFIVAPYEADGQLAFLANIGAVDIVVTEDSDLIGLGVPTLVYKLGGWNGSNAANRSVLGSAPSSHLGTMLHRRDLGSSHDIDLLDFTDAMLATMFVAAGCDYCANLKGIGVKTARNIVKRAFHGANADSEVAVNSLVVRSEPVLKLVLHALFNECGKEARTELLPLDDPSKAEVRMAYEVKFLAALAMYRHPLVYDPIQGVHLVANDVSDGFERRSISPIFLKDERILMEYEPYRNLVTNRESLYKVIGSPSSPEIAKGIAEGVIDPRRIPAETETAVPEDGQGGEETSTTLQSGSELLSSQDFSGAGTQQSKYSSSEGISSPDLLASPSPLRNLV